MRVDLDDVAVRFSGVTVFRGLSAAFESGMLTGIAGPSGSGKTTALSLVAGTRQPDEGRVVITIPHDGRHLRPRPRFVAWVPQGSQVIPSRSAVENTMVGALSEGASLTEALRRAGAALASVDLAAHADVPARHLSGGELQRLAFARAIATRRPIILADEPTANLDRTNASLVIASLRRMQTDRIVIVATHDEAVLAAMSAVVHLGSVA
jgi:ABC-type lipoprotein export system ATPase subunit